MNSVSEKLTVAEISHLWNSFMFDSIIHSIYGYFSANVDDEVTKKYTETVVKDVSQHLKEYADIFNKDNLPAPIGLTTEDVNLKAPRLFTDNFYLIFAESMTRFALTNFSMAYGETARSDVKNLFKARVDQIQQYDQYITEILISKNLYVKPPVVDIPDAVEYVDKKHFFSGFIGEKRNLSVFEIKQLYWNLQSNVLGKALMSGFSQIANSKEVKDYMLKGRELSEKYVKQFADKLLEEDIFISTSLDSEVLTFPEVESPFSDKLMLNHTVFLNAFGIGNYGLSLAQSQRRDITALYGKVMLEVGLYSDNGADLLIKNHWLEQPPLTTHNRKTVEA